MLCQRLRCGVSALLAVVVLGGAALRADDGKNQDEAPAFYPVAVLPFQERGREAAELGTQVSDLLFVGLVTNPNLYLVEREDVKKLFEEQELNLSGLVSPQQATQVGHLTGAKVLVTGSVIVNGDNLYLVAKVIGTETSRVLGASAKGRLDDNLDALVERLTEEVASTILERGSQLVPSPSRKKDRLAALRKAIGKGKRPSVWIDVSERHVGQTTIDPAAATELAMLCRELGFEVIDRDQGDRNSADVLLVGEGFSQFASRHGNLTSVKARLELKAVDRKKNRVLAIDREVTVAVDLAEQIAGKTALQEAAGEIVERLLPKIVRK